MISAKKSGAFSASVMGAFGLAACAASAGGRATPAPAVELPRLELPRSLGAGSTVLVGDLHGTKEIPAFVGQLVSALTAHGPVVLGLEISPAQLPGLDAFLASDGGAAAKAAALRDPWWRSEYQDGRRSVAMFELLEAMRRARAGGRRIEVACFDIDHGGEVDAERREEVMAANVRALRGRDRAAAVVIYAGNLHTRRAGVSFKPDFVWMAMRLAKAGVDFVSLNVRYSGGTAWTCTSANAADCGAHPLEGIPHERGVHLEPSSDGGYDGWFGLGEINASPPAAR